jgi:hypothetical protein
MKYDKIPSNDYVMRQISPSRLRKDGDGKVVGILAEAFEQIQPDGLSVTWVDFWNSDEFQRPFDARAAIQRTRPSKNAGYACANCEAIISVGVKSGSKIRILHDPLAGNDGHALVKIPEENVELFDLLAREIFTLEHAFSK